MRGTLLSVVAAFAGSLLVVLVHPLLGICVTAWSLAFLVFGRRSAVAWVLGPLAGAAATWLAWRFTYYGMFLPIEGVPVTGRMPLVYLAWVTLSFLLAGPCATCLLRRHSPFAATSGVTVGLAALQVLALGLLADGAGMGLVKYVETSLAATVSVLGLPSDVAGLLSPVWPGVLIATCGVAGTMAVAGVGRVANRTGVTVHVLPPLAAVDLSPWLTLLPIVGLAAYAGSMLSTSFASTLEVVGINVLMVSWCVFFFQGLAVFAGLFDRVRLGRSGRLIGYAVVCVTELFLPIVSLIGLGDIWLNLRRLPREGAASGG